MTQEELQKLEEEYREEYGTVGPNLLFKWFLANVHRLQPTAQSEPDGYIFEEKFYTKENFTLFCGGQTFFEENKPQPVWFNEEPKAKAISDEDITTFALNYVNSVDCPQEYTIQYHHPALIHGIKTGFKETMSRMQPKSDAV